MGREKNGSGMSTERDKHVRYVAGNSQRTNNNEKKNNATMFDNRTINRYVIHTYIHIHTIHTHTYMIDK